MNSSFQLETPFYVVDIFYLCYGLKKLWGNKKERKKEKGCARIGDATFSHDLINLVKHKGTHFATLYLIQIENDTSFLFLD
jgi:hypothetical protein